MKFDSKKTAVLCLDVQEGILSSFPGTENAVAQGARVVQKARDAKMHLIHVGLGFEAGYPEISPKHPRFSGLRERGVFLKGSASAQIHPSVFQPGDLVVHKHRVSAFSGNALQMILQAQDIETLVLFGFATSGIVLSTLRMASDLDYNCVVVKDACMDRDEEVHRVLTEKVFAAQAAVLTAEEFENHVARV